jgi:glycosyltransferase involved in cell wall biosynthesis
MRLSIAAERADMRIVVDLQACQSASRFRGIGRYSRSLAGAMLRADRGHEFWIALNGGLPGTVEAVRAAFDGLLPQDRIVAWDTPFAPMDDAADAPWRRRIAEVVREDFLRALRPDTVHVASLFEGGDEDATTSIGRGSGDALPTVVTLYDLIPLAMPAQYLPDATRRRWYERKLDDLRRADLCLAISDFSRRQAVELIGLPAARIANISGACDAQFRILPEDPARDAALRARHGLARPFAMYAGGFDPRKNVDGLVRAYGALPAALRARHQLLIVGEPPPSLRAELETVARGCGLGADDVRFAGFVDDTELVALYNACALYVFPSRCEGFGLPALEAMACGAPVIGADDSSLPEVIGYPDAMFDPASDASMTARIRLALEDPEDRARLRAHGQERVRLFSWDATASRALDAIEQLHAGLMTAQAPVPPMDAAAARMAAIAAQSRTLSRLVAGHALPRDAGRRIAAAQSLNHPIPGRRRQLLVDVSNLAARDAGTGIQRVVRNIVRELLAEPPSGFDVVPVAFDATGACRHATAFARRMRGAPPPDAVPAGAGIDAPVDALADARAGDVFLGLDLSAHIVPGERAQFERWRDAGVALHFVVYDLIPLLRPDVVDPGIRRHLEQWYAAIGELADGLCCISRAVASDLLEWCDQARPARLRPLQVGHFHLGAELDDRGRHAAPAEPLDETSAHPASTHDSAFAGERPTFLMVGTLEPRKGHVQALDAMERLWACGVDANLAIVGQPGWLMDAFAERLRSHPEHGRRLHWLARASDAHLRAMYRDSSALLVASEAEGFGLPLIEAARHGLPVIARDLPVFREVAGAHARWFAGYGPEALADALASWLEDWRRGDAPGSDGMRWIDWRESTRQLLACVVSGHWDARWQPGSRYRFPANDPRFLHQVGAYDRDAWRSDGRAGFLAYGPYARLPAGDYVLTVRGELAGAAGACWFDAVVDRGRARLLHAPLDGDRAAAAVAGACRDGLLLEAKLRLDADAGDLELRVWVDEGVDLRLRGIDLVRVSAAG